ncbi:MAG: hypothetical protein HQK51_16035 [Oligoflexia bacterium]|nr:hypothetical protein [Oligoflexia bacterium]
MNYNKIKQLFFLCSIYFATMIPVLSKAEINPNIPNIPNINEKQITAMSSQALEQRVYNELLDLNPLSQIDKVKHLIKKVQARKEEAQRIFFYNNLFKGEGEEDALSNAKKEDAVIGNDLILSKLNLLLKNNEAPEVVAHLAREILLLDSSFKDNAKKRTFTQLLEDARIALFDHHVVQRERRNVDVSKNTLPSNLIDLKNGGRYLTNKELMALINSGEDISLLNPPDSHFWKKPLLSISSVDINKDLNFGFRFQSGATFTIDSIVLGGHGPKIKVEREELLGKLKIKKWKCKFGEEVNTEVASSRIARLLGYKADLFFYAKDLKVYMNKNFTIDKFKKNWLRIYQGEARLKSLIMNEGKDEIGEYVVFHEASCRPTLKNEKRIGVYHLSAAGNDSLRELRGNLLLQAFVGNADIKEDHNNKLKLVESPANNWEIATLIRDVGNGFGHTIFPNNPNRFSHVLIDPKYHSLKSDIIKLNFRRYHYIGNPTPFMHCHYSDLKWMARYLAEISSKQLKDILAEGNWPPPIQRLLMEKLSHRRNDIVRAFDLEREGFQIWPTVVKWPSPTLFNYRPGGIDGTYIRRGKLIKNFTDPDYYFPTDYMTSISELFHNNNPTIKVNPFLKWDEEEDLEDLNANKDADLITLNRGLFFSKGKAKTALKIMSLKENSKEYFVVKLKVLAKDQTPKSLQKSLEWVNTIVNDPTYFVLTPSLYGYDRYGDLFTKIVLKFDSYNPNSVQEIMRAVSNTTTLAHYLQKMVQASGKSHVQTSVEIFDEYLPLNEIMMRKSILEN